MVTKIHVEKLTEDAHEWWNSLLHESENIIIREYMKAKGIQDNDVSW